MATEVLELQVRTSGVGTTKSEIESIGKSADLVKDSLAFMRAALVAVGTVKLASGFIEFVDKFDDVQNRLRPLTDGFQQLHNVTNALGEVATQTRERFEDVSGTFAAFTQALARTGIGYDQILEITKEVTEAVRLNGGSLQSAKGAIDQFALSLGSGALSGRGVVTVMKTMPVIAEAIASKFGIAGDQLKAFVQIHPGLITTRDVLQALADSAGDIQEKFDKVEPTITNGFENIRTAAIVFFGNLNQGTGIGKDFFDVLNTIAKNIDTVALAIAGLIALVAINFFFSNLLTLVTTLFTFVGYLASVFTVFGTVVAGIVDVVFALNTVLYENPIILGIAVVAVAALAAYFVIFGGTIEGLVPSLNDVKGTLDVVIAAFTAFVVTGVDAVKKFPALCAEFVTDFANLFIAAFEFILKKELEFINFFVSTATAGMVNFQAQIDGVTFGRLHSSAQGTFASLGTEFSAVFTNVVNSKPVEGALNFITSKIKSVQDYLKQFALAAHGPLGTPPPGVGTGTGGDALAKDQAAKLLQLQNQIEALIGKVSPYAAAIAEIDKVNTLLGKNAAVTAAALAKVGLTQDDVTNRILREKAGVGNALTDMTDRMKLLDLAQSKNALSAGEYEQALRKLNSAALSLIESVNPLIAAQNKFKDDTLALTTAVSAHLITQQQMDETLVKLQRDQVGVGNALSDLTQKETLLNQALAAGNVTLDEYTKQLRSLQIAYLDTQTDTQSGFERGVLKVQQEYTDTSKLAEQVFTDAFSNLSDTLTNFFSTGKLNFKKFIDDILNDLTKLAVRDVFIKPLANALGLDANGQVQGGGGLGAILGIFTGGSQAQGAAGAVGNAIADPISGAFQQQGQGVATGIANAFTNQGGSLIDKLISALTGGGSGGGGGLGSLFGGGSGGGLGGIFDGLFGGGGGGGVDPVTGIGFASGGSFMVKGNGGIDQQTVAFRATPGERVTIQPPGENNMPMAGAVHVTFNVTTPDADSFRRNQGQLALQAQSTLSRASRRNG